MIGHYVNNLTPEQEDRVLTAKMRPGGMGFGCLVACAIGNWDYSDQYGGRGLSFWPTDDYGPFVGDRYDDLCRRFSGPRINAAIRNRILSNRARRMLSVSAQVPEAV